ncbi:hypothetical protein [Helicobacter ganmani]
MGGESRVGFLHLDCFGQALAMTEDRLLRLEGRSKSGLARVHREAV